MKRRRASLVHVLPVKTVGEPPTGNLYKRFDEGNGLTPVPTLLPCVETAHFGKYLKNTINEAIVL